MATSPSPLSSLTKNATSTLGSSNSTLTFATTMSGNSTATTTNNTRPYNWPGWATITHTNGWNATHTHTLSELPPSSTLLLTTSVSRANASTSRVPNNSTTAGGKTAWVDATREAVTVTAGGEPASGSSVRTMLTSTVSGEGSKMA